MVDLPQPDGPSRATKEPIRAARSTPSRATTEERPRLERLAESSETYTVVDPVRDRVIVGPVPATKRSSLSRLSACAAQMLVALNDKP